MMSRSAGAPVHGRQLVLVLLTILLGTVVLPPLAAWRLNQHRIDQTRERARNAAASIAAGVEALAKREPEINIACGPGRLPKASGQSGQQDWIEHAVVAPEVFGDGMPTDAWGQCFLMNLGEQRRGGVVWIVSPGPNGTIDTPYGAPVLTGDDIGVVVK